MSRAVIDMVFNYIHVYSVTKLGGGTVASCFNVLDPRFCGSGVSPGQAHCVMFLDRKLYSHRASLHPGVLMGIVKLKYWG